MLYSMYSNEIYDDHDFSKLPYNRNNVYPENDILYPMEKSLSMSELRFARDEVENLLHLIQRDVNHNEAQQNGNRENEPLCDLLALLSDENHNNHAPDLLTAVKLWIDIYADDTHIAGTHQKLTDAWFKDKNISAHNRQTRLRTICTPKRSMHSERKR